MKFSRTVFYFLASFAGICNALSGKSAAAPVPFGAVPSERQLAWHQLEMYAFVHYTLNTYTDKEWGSGDESPALFAPTQFDANQIVRTVKEAGLQGLILTCKHHDGFCLWPSRYTEHSVKHSPYKNGRGDLVKEISDACRRQGIKFGVYLSPWDRNRADYGSPSYIEYYRNQLRELLTNYGPIFEVWFDGANGGSGYYGGANETRKIDNTTYYDWDNTWKIVRELQPQAAIFSDGGPDARWVGNEKGVAGNPCWATINAKGFLPGHAHNLETGDRLGEQWLPAEVDVSIRPGWFYHAAEDASVRSANNLYELYLTSVGRGANLILNLPPDRRGVIPEEDVKSLRGWKKILDETFAQDLARGAKITASQTRQGDGTFGPARVADGRRDTYWSTDDKVTNAEVVLDLGKPQTFNLVRLREYLPLGQRIDRVGLDAWNEAGKRWDEIATATSIGAQRLISTADVTTARVRVRVIQASACPALSEIGLFFHARPQASR
jgi:alpha-L-fucosidase